MIKKITKLFPFSIKDIFVTLFFVFVATLVCSVLRIFEDGNVCISMVYLLSVFLISRFTKGYLFGIVAAIVSVMAMNYTFTYPYYKFNLAFSENATAFVSTLVVAVITSAMTTRTQKQEEIKVAAEKEKMRGNLLRAISHDLRTPLTSISGIANFVCESKDKISEEELKSFMENIKDDSAWLIRMVENLLAVTKFSDGNTKIEKTLEIVDEICAEAIEKIKKRYGDIKINAGVSNELLFVPMDAILIEQVIINLVENSVKHGKITENININVSKKGEFAEFEISDDGVGATDISTLFTPELRKNRNFVIDNSKDMGIGLSVCKTIIKAHNGKITAENISPHGLKIIFTLPLENEETEVDFNE